MPTYSCCDNTVTKKDKHTELVYHTKHNLLSLTNVCHGLVVKLKNPE